MICVLVTPHQCGVSHMIRKDVLHKQPQIPKREKCNTITTESTINIYHVFWCRAQEMDWKGTPTRMLWLTAGFTQTLQRLCSGVLLGEVQVISELRDLDIWVLTRVMPREVQGSSALVKAAIDVQVSSLFLARHACLFKLLKSFCEMKHDINKDYVLSSTYIVWIKCLHFPKLNFSAVQLDRLACCFVNAMIAWPGI